MNSFEEIKNMLRKQNRNEVYVYKPFRVFPFPNGAYRWYILRVYTETGPYSHYEISELGKHSGCDLQG